MAGQTKPIQPSDHWICSDARSPPLTRFEFFEVVCMAMASTTLQVRLPVKLRDEASETLEEMGLDLPTAIRLYLTKVVKTRRIPFELEAYPVVEVVQVDEALQGRMDRIGAAWKKVDKKR
jgi:DNA-damage-inducible protein J